MKKIVILKNKQIKTQFNLGNGGSRMYKGYELHDFQNFLNDVKGNNMKYNLTFEFFYDIICIYGG